MSEKLKRKKNFFLILSLLLTFGPLIGFGIFALMTATVSQQVVLASCFVTAAILTVINVIAKLNLKSIIWIVLFGIYFAIQSFSTVVIVMAITQLVDELIITPLYKHYNNRYKIHKEIDARECEKLG